MKLAVRKLQTPVSSGAVQQMLAFASLIVLVVVFSLLSNNFFQFSNIIGILFSTAVIGVLALGSTFVIIAGGIDLSVGTAMTLCSVMTGVFIVFWSLPAPVGVLGGITTGAFCGFLCGGGGREDEHPPVYRHTGDDDDRQRSGARHFGNQTDLFQRFSRLRPNLLGSPIPGFEIPNAVLIFFGLAIAASLLLSKTIVGRYNFAIGSNEEAARLSGVNVNFWKIVIYTVTGAFTGIAGVLMASRLNSAQPALGMGYELEAIAAVVIGGTSLGGGKGTILGTVIGALIMSVLTNGLRILSVPQEWQTVVVGLVIILAVYADILRRRKE